LFLAVCLFSGIGLQLVNPQIVRNFIDAVQAGSPLQTLTHTALLYLGVALAQYALRLATTYLSEDIGWTTTNALRLDLAAHCLRLDLPFHHAHTPGALIERVDGDVSNLANFFSQMVLNLLGNALLLIGTLAVLWLEDWRLGLAFTLFAGVVIAFLGSMREIATPHLRAERQASADLFGFIEERLSGTEDIRANGAGPRRPGFSESQRQFRPGSGTLSDPQRHCGSRRRPLAAGVVLS
jgi:ABC-type multidrug transport system fused ATPase/permease subunit